MVNSYLGVQGSYDMPTYIVPVDAAQATIVMTMEQLVDINLLTMKLKSPSVATGLPPDYISLNRSEFCMILEATRGI